MKKKSMLKALVLRPVEVLGLSVVAVAIFSSCVGSGDGIESAGDPNYWTTSRGQFTNTLADGTIMYFLNNGDGTATVTFDGRYPLQQMDPQSSTVKVNTYNDDIIIPSTAELTDGTSVPVVEIGERAFCANKGLRSVVIPSSVKVIGEGAFELCDSVESITFEDASTITSIGSAAFARCKASLNSLEIPQNITKIPSYTYMYCPLTEIVIPDAVDSIGNAAFYGCASNTTVTIPAGVTYIGHSAFGATKMTEGIHFKSATPPTIGTVDGTTPGDILYGITESVLSQPTFGIYVPAGSEAAYAEIFPNYTSYIKGE